MINKTKVLAAFLGLSLVVSASGCGSSSEEAPQRWATTENTNVKIDWDKVNEAYKAAEGPEDLERRINEIYEGDEIISISVLDVDDKTQVVTGFFDKNTDGKADEPEKIFTIKRDLAGNEAKVQTTGYGPYAGYVSPMLSIMSGMMLGAMVSSMFMPSYAPMYRGGYVTSPSRAAALSAGRSSFRAANSERFSKPSQSGRAYGGGQPSSGGTTRSRGGSRFGTRGRGPLLPV
jgi:hypothetical protein